MSEGRRKSSTWLSLLLQASAGPVGLILGYFILCQFGPQYDFLGVWYPSNPATAPVAATSNSNNGQGWPFRKTVAKPAEKAPLQASADAITKVAPSPTAPPADTPTKADGDSVEVVTRSPVVEPAIPPPGSPDDKTEKSDGQVSDSRTDPPPQAEQTKLPFTAVAGLQQAVARCRMAKEVVQLLSATIVDASVPEETRTYASSLMPVWEEHAAADYMRLGASWMPRLDAVSRREKANDLLSHAAELLSVGSDQQALERLVKASKLDPEATTAVFLMGAHFALGLKNYQEAKEYFNDCLHRQPDDAGSLNNLALANLMLGRQAEGLKTFRAAVDLNSRSAEIAHNVRRVLKQDGLKALVLAPTEKKGFADLLSSVANDERVSALDNLGWLYMLPITASAAGALPPEVPNVLQQFGRSKTEKTVKVHVRWIEDCQCAWCRGMGKAPCTNPDCKNGQVIVKTGQENAGKDPVTKKTIYRDVFGPKNCPTCNGAGYLNCAKCAGIGIDPSLSGVRIEVSNR